MKNIQIIDGALNATFSLFQATDEEFAAIFPNGSDMQIIEDVFERLGQEQFGNAVTPMWDRPVLKIDAVGIHGTLLYDSEDRREHLPASRREVDWDVRSINAAQRVLFASRQ